MPDDSEHTTPGTAPPSGTSPRSGEPDRSEAGMYAEKIRSGDRSALARAITRIESSRPEHNELGRAILRHCLPYTGNSIRIAVTGVPGAGKSTFIETLGSRLIQEGKRIAVLAVDPSSSKSRGSILGDKTRMLTLSQHPDAFIRPTPTSGTLGGVTLSTRESLLLCEAAGFEIIFVETTGVGQSETAAHSMTDLFLLLMLAGAGDELQGIKRGIMEMADLIAVHKAEASQLQAVNRAINDIEHALSLMPEPMPGWSPPVLACSSLEGSGIREVWEKAGEFIRLSKSNGTFRERRSAQSVYWMHETLKQEMIGAFYRNPDIKAAMDGFEERVRTGSLTIYEATSELMRIGENRLSKQK